MEVASILAGLLLIVGCGLFVAAEFSLITVNRNTVREAADSGDKKSVGVLKAMNTLSTQYRVPSWESRSKPRHRLPGRARNRAADRDRPLPTHCIRDPPRVHLDDGLRVSLRRTQRGGAHRTGVSGLPVAEG